MSDDNSSMISSWGLGTTLIGGSIAFGIGCLDASTADLSFGVEGIGDYTASTGDTSVSMSDAADGNYPALTTVLGLMSLFSGSSSAGPDSVIEIFFNNKQPYNRVERKAKEIYDKYDHNHTKSKDDGATLIASPEAAEIVNDIVASAKSKEELVACLGAIEVMLREQEKTNEGKSPKTKTNNHGKTK